MRREVEGGLPGAVMRADVRQQWAVPGAEERQKKRDGGRGDAGNVDPTCKGPI